MPKIRIRQSDKYFSLWIRYRDRWTCQRCHRRYTPPTQGLHCSHFMGRGKEATRHEPKNCDAICMGCHLYFTANPAEHYTWQVQKKGQTTVDKLVLASNQYQKRQDKLEAVYWKQRLKEDFGIKV